MMEIMSLNIPSLLHDDGTTVHSQLAHVGLSLQALYLSCHS